MNSWTTLGKVDQTVHSGWNIIRSTTSNTFRYIRFYHNSTSQCNIAEIQLFGIVYSNTLISNINSQSSNVIYDDGFNLITLADNITYTSANTAII